MRKNDKVYLAVDLGASSGRVVAGLFDGHELQIEEAARFVNGGVYIHQRMYWDLLGLWRELQQGLRGAATRYENHVVSVGVDTWGVDFGLLGRGDELLGNPAHYRDRRTAGILARAFEIVPRDEIFAATGLQFMEFNTLYQLLAMRLAGSPLLDQAERFLMMPDLFHWLLSGEKSNEQTDASTTQCYNPLTGQWATDLLERFGLPTHIFGPITPPGTRLGKVLPDIAEATGLAGVEVVLPGAHDTAAAVLAAPAASRPGETPDWCYISSGTWSLMGVETPAPIINGPVARYNFTNEGGVGGATRLLKNIAGLWLVQECRRVWREQGVEYTFERLVQLASEAPPLASLVDPDHPSLLAPKDMPEAIRALCRASGQPVPASEGAVIRCALESLALRYRLVLGWLEEIIGRRIETIHIVGGGAQNKLLCQMAADACGRRVVSGPSEATAIGNVMMQALAAGDIGSIADAREIVRRSFDVDEYLPQRSGPWDEAFARFTALVRA